MKNLTFYADYLGCQTEDEVFQFLIGNLKPSNRLWTYFVNWEKVLDGAREFELALNKLNYLIGKEDFDGEFRYLLKRNPDLVTAIPALVVRDGNKSKKFKILVDYKDKKLKYEDYDFTKKELTDEDIEKYLTFVKCTGLKDLISNRNISNFVDYMIGVEAGLDSNGRKNRGGSAMENIVDAFIQDLCNNNEARYLKEANANKIKATFGWNIPVDKSSRRYDFVIDNSKEIFLIETNFYGGGGSKLKSTAGEFRNLSDFLKSARKDLNQSIFELHRTTPEHQDYGINFVWITDGKGWTTTQAPLRETFDNNDYVFSLSMLERGILNHLILG